MAKFMDRAHIPNISYTEFDGRLSSQISEKRIPVHGFIKLTFRCNLSCVHHYCNLHLNDQNAIENELKAEEVFRLFDKIAEASCLWLLITWGGGTSAAKGLSGNIHLCEEKRLHHHPFHKWDAHEPSDRHSG